MVQNNKVLTVSYGTFSCTLEGFDDSFGTMKAIAEYFRDLAADDRYFGAEPPQPDADMLARIAEREIARQVEARRDSKGIVLRAAAPLAAPAEAAEAADADAASPRERAGPGGDVAYAPAADDRPPTEPQTEQELPDAQDDAQDVAQDVDTDAAGSAAEAASDVAPAPFADKGAEAPGEPALPESDEQPADEPVAAEATEQPEVAGTPDVEPEPEPVAADPLPLPDAGESADQPAPAEQSEPAPAAATAEMAEPEAAETDEPFAEPEGGDRFDDDAPDLPDAELIADAIEDPAEPVARDAAGDDADDATLAAVAAHAMSDAQAGEAEPVAEAEPVEPPEAVVPAGDSIAAKLQRIRAVVARTETSEPDEYEDEYAEDEHAADVVSTAAMEISEAFEADEELSDGVESEYDDVDQALSVLDRLVEDEARAGGASGEDSIFADIDDDEEAIDEDADGDELDNILGTGRHAGDAVFAGRVLKVKRGEFDAAQDDAGADDGQTAAAAGSLSAEDEEDLQRELAEVEAELRVGSDDAEQPEIDDDGIDDDAAPADHAAEAGDEAGDIDEADDGEGDETGDAEAAQVRLDQTGDDDLSRLLAETDEKLHDPEGSESRETYSQLRAAVASAEAERSAGGSVDTTADDDPYREDLATVVRPRRPSVDPASAGRPRSSMDRPAPLKLVAEQRIDTPDLAANRGPVRPRRVAAVEEEAAQAAAAQEGGFAEYAERTGAVSLPDLLEAAAAYMSFVEGREQFSRPQLMNKVRQLDDQEFNREDGLRSFGQLLREGKIEKRGGGRFAASREIGFQPDKRAVG